MRALPMIALGALLCGCQTYHLVGPDKVAVADGALSVRPGVTWNQHAGTIRGEEVWTQNGPLLDSITFIAGLADGSPIARQKAKDNRRVPVFKADMGPSDLTAMVESYYRIKLQAQVFTTRAVVPATLAGRPAIQFDYDYVVPDEVPRRGRALICVQGGKLYLVILDGTALHYFDAALPGLAAIVSSAAIR